MTYTDRMTSVHPKARISALCKQFYTLGWVSGTGGGIAIRDGQMAYMAPSGVQKEQVEAEDLFTVDLDGKILEHPADPKLTLSACAPLFLAAFRLRDAGAVLHSHSQNALLATLTSPEDAFRCTHLEMMKGIAGTGYHDVLEVPIIENTAHECDLADSLSDAIRAWPRAHAVLVRRHGVYVWGKDWIQAKTHAECYDYLFGAVARMRELGLDPMVPR